MMFSGKIFAASLVLSVMASSVEAQIVGADCWFDDKCTPENSNILVRNQDGVSGAGCQLPAASSYPLPAGQYPAAYYMGDGPAFCGNRKSGIMDNVGRARREAIQFCFDIGASSACIWGECNNPTEYPDWKCISTPPGVWGDPHFKTWTGTIYDFHGVCDLLFVESKSHNLKVHVRTTQKYHYSYVSSAVVELNGETMEFGGYGSIIRNGVYETDDTELPKTLGGMPITLNVSNKKTHAYEIMFEDGTGIEFKSFKEMVGVKLIGSRSDFADSRGLMGSAVTGEKLARDGVTVIEDDNAFGQEWQVREDEAILFETAREPQAPRMCHIPEATKTERRLGETIARADAEAACSNWHMNKEACISDVMMTGDREMAANVF